MLFVHQTHESRTLPYASPSPQCPAQGLAHSRAGVGVCWVNEWRDPASPLPQITGVGTETPLSVLARVLGGWTPQLVAFVLNAFRDRIISVDGGADARLAEGISPILWKRSWKGYQSRGDGKGFHLSHTNYGPGFVLGKATAYWRLPNNFLVKLLFPLYR